MTRPARALQGLAQTCRVHDPPGSRPMLYQPRLRQAHPPGCRVDWDGLEVVILVCHKDDYKPAEGYLHLARGLYPDERPQRHYQKRFRRP